MHDLPSFVLLVLLFVVLVLPGLSHDGAHVPHNVSPPGKVSSVPLWKSENQIEYYVCYEQSKCIINLLAYGLGLGLWCLTPLSTIVHLYHGGQFNYYWKTKCLEKTTDPSQVTNKLYHIMLHRVHLVISRIRTHNLSDETHLLHK